MKQYLFIIAVFLLINSISANYFISIPELDSTCDPLVAAEEFKKKGIL